jgi:hypothetical protein
MKLLLRRCASLTSTGSISIAARLHIGFGLVLLLLGAVGALSWYQTDQMASKAACWSTLALSAWPRR